VSVFNPALPAFDYDLNGNLLTDRSAGGTTNRSFAYDDENQLIAVWETNAWKSEFTYDGKMRRRIRKEFTWNGSSWTQTNEVRYVYDGNLVIQERDAGNLPQATYTRGRDVSGMREGAGGIGGLLARTANSATLNSQPANAYYDSDGSGNVTCLIDSNQVVIACYEYDPFGTVIAMSGSMADLNLYRFSSKEFHANSGLVYYLYRYYEPSLQRWPNRDPINEPGFGVMNGSSGSFNTDEDKNLYLFIRNSPIVHYDPYGNSALSVCLPVAGGCAVADGPLPVGDIIAVGILAGAVAWDVCFSRKLSTCTVRCHVVRIGAENDVIGSIQATATGPNRPAACAAAASAARNGTAPGTRAKHCFPR
jgi:RHS repeat-associated protein